MNNAKSSWRLENSSVNTKSQYQVKSCLKSLILIFKMGQSDFTDDTKLGELAMGPEGCAMIKHKLEETGRQKLWEVEKREVQSPAPGEEQFHTYAGGTPS